MQKSRLSIIVIALVAIAAAAYYFWPVAEPVADVAEPPAEPGALTAEQIKRLGIELAAAETVNSIPLGSVSGTINLPPDARVAVAAPFDGIVTQLLVMEGQAVSRGQALAIIRAPQPVQIGADLARAEADLGYARANAGRLNTLAREGIIAGARADEANAAVRQAEVNVSENRRLLGQSGASGNGTITLRAPIAGRVADIAIAPGGPVSGMAAPFIIEATDRLIVDLQLPERMAKTVRPGMAVEIVLTSIAPGGAPVTVGGQILSVAPSIDPMTRSVMAKASIGNAPGLVPGTGVMVTIQGGEAAGGKAAGGVSVPSAAVTRVDGKDYVYVRTAKGFERREVVLITNSNGRAILSGGLVKDEQVAVKGVAELKSLLAE
jgi:membrane fusion protein, heavy metal efflux system